MATESRAGHSRLALVKVEKSLRAQPYCFRFFQAVRLLTRMQPGRGPVGRYVPPGREAVRFVAHQSMAFPASDIQALEWPEDGVPRMTVNFMGLTGPNGVLPLFWTELTRQRQRAGDRAMIAFFDLFNHRMTSLFYLAWEKYHFLVSYERGERDRFSHHVLCLLGLGTPGLTERQDVADESLLFYSGLLGLHTRSPAALQALVGDYFGVPARVQQFIGTWYRLSRNNQCMVGGRAGISEQLGIGAVVGDEVWDQQSGVRIVLGPLKLRQYLDFLPSGSAYRPLRAITRYFCDGQLDFEVQLVLKRDEVPLCELGSDSEAGPRLGWLTWAKTKTQVADPADTILKL